MALLKKLNVDVLTRWRQAHVMLVDSEEWAADDDLRNLPSLDILLPFEDYSRVREREFEDQMRREQVEKRRRERKAREGFKVSILSLLYFGFVCNMYPHIGASEGACRFWDYQGKVQKEGRLPAPPG